jgi:hypothetical protein
MQMIISKQDIYASVTSEFGPLGCLSKQVTTFFKIEANFEDADDHFETRYIR